MNSSVYEVMSSNLGLSLNKTNFLTENDNFLYTRRLNIDGQIGDFQNTNWLKYQ